MKDILQPLFNQFMPFAQKRMGFNKPPRVFLRDDPQNAQNPLGKTAYYDPEQMSVTLYIHGRHPKDIMRSLSHELVHHTQNCNGQFNRDSEMGEGYAQRDPHLREMEREAYEQGNLCFRDWEDSIKNTIYIQNLNVNIQKEGKLNMSTKDWKNRELPTLLTEKWGFSFNMLTESQEEVVEEAAEDETLNEEEEELEEGMCQQCAPNPCGCRPMEEGEEPELEEGASSSGRAVTPDRGGEDRRANDERKRPMEEGEDKKPDADGDGVPDYADKKPGEDDNKDKDEEEKSDKDLSKVPPQLRKHVKGKMDEAQIRNLIRKLVKEAMNKKENK
jgi:hypothetical protein